MWSWPDRSTITCIACGESLDRDEAREYDKHGDRWDRREKEFEYVCKPCDRELCHQPRDGLESVLVEIESKSGTPQQFIDAYYTATKRGADRTKDDVRE
jgi:hypothetical protein